MQQYHEIIIPTKDSARSTYLTKLLLTNNYHVMLPGPTGTGKSINSHKLLATGLDETYQYISIVFSAQTSANQTQDTIDLKLEKIKRGVFGAPVGKKYIVFVDDLNMPKK
jgi:dynein heavy chain